MWLKRLYHLVKDYKDERGDVPPPIFQAALKNLESMASASETMQPEVEDPPQVFYPRCPLPGERDPLVSRLRKKKGYRDQPNQLQAATREGTELLEGVEEARDLLFMFTASADGVSTFRFSKSNNSVYVFSLLSENLVRRRMVEGLDAFFLIIVPCTKAKPLYARPVTEEASKEGVSDVTTASGLNPESRISDPLNRIQVNIPEASIGKKMADQEFHCVLSIVLREMKKNGREGFPLVVGSTLYSIRYAITSFRADMPASNFLRGFPGRHSSNNPCSRCKLQKRVYDPVACLYYESVSCSQHQYRTQLKTVNSSVTCLPADHPLRLLRAYLWTRIKKGNLECFEEGLRTAYEKRGQRGEEVLSFLRSEKFQELKTALQGTASFLPPIKEVPLADETTYFAEVDSKRTQPDPNLQNNNSRLLDLTFYTWLKPEYAVAVDMMHTFHNVFDRIVPVLLQDTVMTKLGEEVTGDINSLSDMKKKMAINRVLNKGRVSMKMKEAEDSNYMTVSQEVRDDAQKRFLAVESFPKSIASWIGSLFGDDETPIRAHEKICFCAGVLPYLLIDSMKRDKVGSMVLFIALLCTVFNHDLDGHRLHQYQTLIHICLNIIELQMPPAFESTSMHGGLHLEQSFTTSGPLKGNDTLRTEHLYLGLADEATGGRNPVQTIQYRVIIREAADTVSVGLEEDEISVLITAIESMTAASGFRIAQLSRNAIKKLTVINWLSDCARFENDLHPALSFLDLQLNGWVRLYLQGNLSFTETGPASLPPSDDTLLEEDIEWFYDTMMEDRRNMFEDIVFFKSLIWNHSHYESYSGDVKSITGSSVRRGSFGVVYSITGRSHLFVILGYATCYMREEFYVQAIGYEVNKCSVFELFDYPFAFLFNLKNLRASNKKPVLISLHRLIVDDLLFAPINEDIYYCGVCATCMRQWQIIKQITLRPTKEWVKNMETIKDIRLKKKGTRRSSPQASDEDES